jgi:tetratricopeptide (TPR) repeat protein
VTWRYRLHNTVPLLVMAGYGLRHIYLIAVEVMKQGNISGSKGYISICSMLFILGLCGWIAYRPVLGEYQRGFYHRASENDNLSRRAEKHRDMLAELESAVPQNLRLDMKKALILSELHRHTAAFRLLREIHEKGMFHPRATYRYLVYLLWLGDYSEAIRLLRRIHAENPGFATKVLRYLKGGERAVYRVFIEPRMG